MKPSPAASIRQPLESLPESLLANADQTLAEWRRRLGDSQALHDHPTLPGWRRLWALSPWAAETCLRYPQWALEWSLDSSLIDSDGNLTQRLAPSNPDADSDDELRRNLRQFRNREMLRLQWRDLNRRCGTLDTCADVSALATLCLQTALEWHERSLCRKFGAPHSTDGVRQHLCVIGMGKLGGNELNLSSDIDLIFCWDRPCETERGASGQEFFDRLARSVIGCLNDVDRDGFVFRVDTRLRPFGASSALTAGVESMERYYLQHGRDWERYALLKARPVAGDTALGERLLETLHPFLYRRYLDFNALEALRAMHGDIRLARTETETASDIKIGRGGIRQLEFGVQFFQLVFGARHQQLQTRSLLTALRSLGELKYLKPHESRELEAAYLFLRDAEHALQAYADRQTQTLPSQEAQRLVLAAALGYTDFAAFNKALRMHRQRIADFFQRLTTPTDADADDPWRGLWRSAGDSALALLREAGYTDPDEALRLIDRLRNGRRSARLPDLSRRRLDQLMPLLLRETAKLDRPDATLRRCLQIVEAVLGRCAYLSLLAEHPQTLHQLIDLCARSAWIAQRLRHQPQLMDEMLRPESLLTPIDSEQLDLELDNRMRAMKAPSLEDFLEVLQRFRTAHTLSVAVQALPGIAPTRQAEAQLSLIAERILDAIFNFCWQELLKRHGAPTRADGLACDPDFLIVAYGRLGAGEMTYASDLDLVFLYDAPADGRTMGGERAALDNAVFFTRLAQRIIHCLRAPVLGEPLYEIDTRLRPSGQAGMLVSSLDAFSRYQFEVAWLWERQALVRAKPVSGCEKLAKKFEDLRGALLSQSMPEEKLKAEIVDMRARIVRHRDTEADSLEELKSRRGGIMDLEFIAQYGVLRHARSHPELLVRRDTAELLKILQDRGLLPDSGAESLAETHNQMSKILHHRSLRSAKSSAEEAQLAILCARVDKCWETLFGVRRG